MGGGDFLHGERVVDGVVDVRFAHAAHHAVDLHFGFVHVKIISFHTAQETRWISPASPVLFNAAYCDKCRA